MKFRLSSEFGALEEVRKGIAHTGIDLAMPEGTKLRSLFDGTVSVVFDGSGKIGKGVKIQTEDGREIIYGHMNDVDVKVGDHVDAGELIGLSGNTGNSFGAHLHFGMKDEGQFIDPTEYADTLANISGEIANKTGLLGPLGELGVRTFRGHMSHKTEETIYGVLDGIREVLIDSIGSIALVGGGLLMILKVAGYKDGNRYASLLFVVNILVKYLLGGF